MSLTTFHRSRSSAPYALAFASDVPAALGALTPSERREYDLLPRDHQARRLDWLAGRCAAKRAVAEHYGVPIEHVQLAARAGAAPQSMVLDGECWTLVPVCVSVAHCDGVAIAAAADSSTRIGVDIERMGEIAPEHRRYFLAPSEAWTDASLAWVLKEAAWKALGVEPAVPFTSVQLSFDRTSHALQGVRVNDSWIRARADVVRFSQPRPMLAAVLEIGEISATNQEVQ